MTKGGGKIGPKVRELAKLVKQVSHLKTSATVDTEQGPRTVDIAVYASSYLTAYVTTGEERSVCEATSFSAAMVELGRRCGKGKLRRGSVTVKCGKGPLAGKRLKGLVIAAWCEACGEASLRGEVRIERPR